MTRVTKSKLEELRKLDRAGTSGPWEFETNADGLPYNLQKPHYFDDGMPCHPSVLLKCLKGWAPNKDDAALIVASRNSLIELLDEIELLQAENQMLREQEETHDWPNSWEGDT